jgi:hypothetical protein
MGLMMIYGTRKTVILSPLRTLKLPLPLLATGGTPLILGCSGAPSATIAGAYFPAWLLCALVAVVVAIASRGLMVATGLSNVIPLQLIVCVSLGVIAALLMWQFWMVHP